MSEQNMDPKKRNIIIGCSVAGAVVVIAAIIAVIFTTGALNKIGHRQQFCQYCFLF